MKATTVGDVKVYNLSSGKTLPEWLNEKKKSSLRKDEDFKRRIEIIQDFDMPESSKKVKVTKDGLHAYVTGTYPPRIRAYELAQLAMKFERRLDGEPTQLICLGDDWQKLAILRGFDRTIEFHAQFGGYFKVRVPRPARDFLYNPQNCDLCVCGNSSQIYRINLEQGRFLSSIEGKSDSFNVCDVCPAHSLLAFGSDEGVVECFDPRTRLNAAVLDISSHIQIDSSLDGRRNNSNTDCGISALTFCDDGLTMGIGTNNGVCLLYDLRAPTPFAKQIHHNSTPITALRFHHSTLDDRTRVMSVDKSVLRVWEKRNGSDSLMFAVEPGAGDITDLCTVGQSGMIFLAGEFKRVQVMYIPALGPAPRWCSFLDNLTEEMEEAAPNIYADFKFVTKQELVQLGLDRLIGTPYLRAYMHGYFVDMRAYKKVREVVDPFAYDRYRAELVKKKLDAKTQTRIYARTKAPKVNAQMAERLEATLKQDGENQNGQPMRKRGKLASNILNDERFAEMFTNEDYAVNANEAPSASNQQQRRREVDEMDEEEEGNEIGETADLAENFEQIDDENEERVFEIKGESGRGLGEVLKAAAPSQQRKAASIMKVTKAKRETLEERVEENKEKEEEKKKKTNGPIVLGSGRGSSGEKELSFIPQKEQIAKKEKKHEKQQQRDNEGRQQRARRLMESGFRGSFHSSRGGRGGRGGGRGRGRGRGRGK